MVANKRDLPTKWACFEFCGVVFCKRGVEHDARRNANTVSSRHNKDCRTHTAQKSYLPAKSNLFCICDNQVTSQTRRLPAQFSSQLVPPPITWDFVSCLLEFEVSYAEKRCDGNLLLVASQTKQPEKTANQVKNFDVAFHLAGLCNGVKNRQNSTSFTEMALLFFILFKFLFWTVFCRQNHQFCTWDATKFYFENESRH